MRVRLADMGDLPLVMKMAEAAHAESPRYSRYPFVKEKIRGLASAYLNGGPLVVLYAEGQAEEEEPYEPVGYLFGLISPQYFCDVVTASPASLYVRPEWRGSRAAWQIMQKFEQVARERGAAEILAGGSSGLFIEETARLYQKLGYTTLGPTVVKYLE